MIGHMTDTILFDLDGTLFDVKKLFNEYLKPELAQVLNVSYPDFDEVSNGYWKSQEQQHIFNVDDYLAYLVYKYRVTPESLKPTFAKVAHYQQCIYPEVSETLTYLKTKNWQLGIFSEGDAEFQRQKLTASGLMSWFEPELVFITLQKTETEFMAKLPASAVVEDKLRIISALAGASQLEAIWINRDGIPVPPEQQPKPEKVITTLADLKTLFP